MDGRNGDRSGGRPFHSAVSPPPTLLETSHLYDQLFGFRESSPVDFPPFDNEALESGIARLGISDSDVQNCRQTVFNGDYDNGCLINNRIMNNQGVNGNGFLHSASVQEAELARINHFQRLILQNDSVNGSLGFENFGPTGSVQASSNGFFNNSRNVSSLSRSPFLDRRTQNSSDNFLPYPPFDSIRLENLRGMILPLSKDRCYSHLLQQIMDEEDFGEKIDMIFDELIHNVDRLMMDPFGHHVFQKMLEKCNDVQIARIVDMVVGNPFHVLAKICTDSHGTRAMQALMKSLRCQEQVSIVTGSLSIIAVPLSKSNNGHHVIQYCLKHFSPEDNMFLLIEVARNCYQIAIDQHGCCLLQQCMAYCVGEQRQRLAEIRWNLITDIVNNALRLSDHCYGNYVVQYVVELRDLRITTNLLRRLKGNYASLARNKYGSHVVQKCLTESGDEQSERIMYELLRDINMLLLDPYGNYVIQSALIASKNKMRNVLMHCVRDNYPMMRSNKYGRKVLEKLKHM